MQRAILGIALCAIALIVTATITAASNEPGSSGSRVEQQVTAGIFTTKTLLFRTTQTRTITVTAPVTRTNTHTATSSATFVSLTLTRTNTATQTLVSPTSTTSGTPFIPTATGTSTRTDTPFPTGTDTNPSPSPTFTHTVTLTASLPSIPTSTSSVTPAASTTATRTLSPTFDFGPLAVEPKTPNAIGPSGDVSNPVTFRWAGVEGAQRYYLLIYDTRGDEMPGSGWYQPLCNPNCAVILPPSLALPSGTYTWYVLAGNTVGLSSYNKGLTIIVR
jgi:hypothetical protein